MNRVYVIEHWNGVTTERGPVFDDVGLALEWVGDQWDDNRFFEIWGYAINQPGASPVPVSIPIANEEDTILYAYGMRQG